MTGRIARCGFIEGLYDFASHAFRFLDCAFMKVIDRFRGRSRVSEQDGKPEGKNARRLARRSGNHLVSRTTIDALPSLKSHSGKLWRVGEYELHDQDYRQLHAWLEHLDSNDERWTFEEFTSLALRDFYEGDDSAESVVDGTIIRLKLTSMGFRELDISNMPKLASLDCYENQLSELDLSSVPSLTELRCSRNNLTELDLSSVPSLTVLWCDENQLTGLDLSSTPSLTVLRCDGNQLTELDIRICPELSTVTCDSGVLVRKRTDQSVERIG